MCRSVDPSIRRSPDRFRVAGGCRSPDLTYGSLPYSTADSKSNSWEMLPPLRTVHLRKCRATYAYYDEAKQSKTTHTLFVVSFV